MQPMLYLLGLSVVSILLSYVIGYRSGWRARSAAQMREQEITDEANRKTLEDIQDAANTAKDAGSHGDGNTARVMSDEEFRQTFGFDRPKR